MHQRKISLTDSWIRAGFFRVKVVSDFDFEQFSTLLIEYPAPLTELSWQRGRWMILIFHFFHTLGCLVSCPHSFLVRSITKLNSFSSPQWTIYIGKNMYTHIIVYSGSVRNLDPVVLKIFACAFMYTENFPQNWVVLLFHSQNRVVLKNHQNHL